MNCNPTKSACFKSAQTAYNNMPQTITAAGTEIQILGNLITDTGRSIDTTGAGFRFNSGGLYRISYDVTATPTGIGTMVVQLYKDSAPLPCAIVSDTTIAATQDTIHVETIIYIGSCRVLQPIVTAMISGVEGVVDHVCASAVKLA